MTDYLPLTRKDSITHMHGLAVYKNKRLPFALDLSLENSTNSYLYFRLALPNSLSYFFFSIDHLLCLYVRLLILLRLT